MSDIELFKQYLLETSTWCSVYASTDDPEHCLRTAYLQPLYQDNPSNLVWCSTTLGGRGKQLLPGEEALSVVNTVVERRRGALQAENQYPHLKPPLSVGGKLLAFVPAQSLWDGASEEETGGFFDTDNTPPWDTWVQFVRDSYQKESNDVWYLLSWIPEAFINLAQSGIDVNPEGCIFWAERLSSTLPFVGQLKTAGLL